MIITNTSWNGSVAESIEAARTTHTGTKIIEYLTITNDDTTDISATVDFGHASKTFIKGVVIPVNTTLKVIDTPMEINDSIVIRITLGDAAYSAIAHLGIKSPPIKNIKL